MNTILCIDNSETIRKVVQDCVNDLNYHFVEAENGKQGLEMISSIQHLKMIVLDWNMPVMSGRETLRNLRELDSTKDILILVLIKIENKDQVMEAIGLGATNYILKPFSVSGLQNKIEEMMNDAV